MTNQVATFSNRPADHSAGRRTHDVAHDNGTSSERRSAAASVRRESEKSGMLAVEGRASCEAAVCSEGDAQSFDGFVEGAEAEGEAAAQLQEPPAQQTAVQTTPTVAQFSGFLQRLDIQFAGQQVADDAQRPSPMRTTPALAVALDGMAFSKATELTPTTLQSAMTDAALASEKAVGLEDAAALSTDARPFGGAKVSIADLKRDVGFASPVTVVLNEQCRFQSAPAVVARMAMMALQDTNRLGAPLSAGAGREVQSPLVDVDADGIAGEPMEQSTTFGADLRTSPRLSTHSEFLKSEQLAVDRQDVTSASNTEFATQLPDSVSNMSAPSQQVRGAVVDALSAPTTAAATDYATLFQDRPTAPSLMVRTLHLALNPQGLGQVQIKMNLAGNDLRLEIEATRTDTARLIAADRDELNRELRSDGVELTSLAVTVRDAERRPEEVGNSVSGGLLENSSSRADTSMGDMSGQRDQNGGQRTSRSIDVAQSAGAAGPVADALSAADGSALYI